MDSAHRFPSIVVTGASGFIGRRVLRDFKEKFRIFAIARRSQHDARVPFHPNIAWIRADISDNDAMARTFREIASAGGADYLLHLAAYYDFEGRDNSLYRTTNVDGTRNVMEQACRLNLKLFVFVSSVAACSFPPPGQAVDERSAPDGSPYYSRSKARGEQLLREASLPFKVCMARLGAVYSDWCEYPPLYMLLQSWLGNSLTKNALAGKGKSALQYVHVRDVVRFFRQIIRHHDLLDSAQVLIASPSGAVAHDELFGLATRYFFGHASKPIRMPRLLCGTALVAMYVWGQLTGHMRFERPWMYRYIDKELRVDSGLSQRLLDWRPNPRYDIKRRLPFLIEHLKSEPMAWHIKNRTALERDNDRLELVIYNALLAAEDEHIETIAEFLKAGDSRELFPHYQLVSDTELRWRMRLVYRLLLTSIHTSDRLLIMNYFEVTARKRFEDGFTAKEMTAAYRSFNRIIVDHLLAVENFGKHRHQIFEYVSLPFEFGVDEIEHQYQLFVEGRSADTVDIEILESSVDLSARELLEKTIWHCLVHRK